MIEALTGQGINVRHACRVLGVSESGYYDCKDRPTSPRALRRIWLASEIETVARQYHLALTIGGGDIIPDDEMNRIIAKFKAYGPLAKPAAAPLKKPAKKSTARRSPF